MHFEEEEWLEKYGYAMGEDQVLFYKLCIYGYKTVCVTNLKLEHLDAGTSTGGNVERTAFGAGWFKSVFWKRFIYDREKNRVLKVVDKIAFFYCFYSYVIVNKLKALKNKDQKRYIDALLAGRSAAQQFLKNK